MTSSGEILEQGRTLALSAYFRRAYRRRPLTPKSSAACRQVLMIVDAGGKLWSTTVWCLVPAFQHDFGCCGALIGGEPALKKVRSEPAGESVASFASRAWV